MALNQRITRSLRLRLIHQVEEFALKTGDFTLKSGEKSSYYFDMSQVSLSHEGMKVLSTGFFYGAHDVKFNAVGGPVLGAAPLVSVITNSMQGMRGFLVRRDKKGHGDKGCVEGPLRMKDSVLIVEDVTTSGGSVLWAANFVREQYGCEVVKVMSVLDRKQGARELLEAEGYQFESLLDIDDLTLPK